MMVRTSTFQVFRNDSIYLESEEILWIYYLIEGNIRINKSAKGKKQSSLFRLVEVGSFFGYHELLAGRIIRKNSATVMSSKATIEKYELGDFMRKIENDQQFFFKIFSSLSLYENNLWSRVGVMIDLNFNKKMGWMMLNIAKPIDGFENKVEITNFTHQLLSDYTGSSRQSVTSLLNELRRMGIIEYDKHKIVIDRVLMEKKIEE